MSKDLRKRIEMQLQGCRAIGYIPHDFERMYRERGSTDNGLIALISSLVSSGSRQSGFVRLMEAQRADLTIEQAVVDFPDLFPKSAVEAAAFRLGEWRRI